MGVFHVSLVLALHQLGVPVSMRLIQLWITSTPSLFPKHCGTSFDTTSISIIFQSRTYFYSNLRL